MAQDLETAKMAVPVVPVLTVDIPPELTQYLTEVKIYLDAMSRDLKKLGELL